MVCVFRLVHAALVVLKAGVSRDKIDFPCFFVWLFLPLDIVGGIEKW